jgi:tetratricopeptide (TPR) repeat protein
MPNSSGDHGVQIRVRLGLNTGLVVVGRIGDDLRMDYAAVGNTMHLAARLQSMAEPGTMLITEATHRLVEGYVHSEALGPVKVRGQREPVTMYRVIARRRRTRLEISAERGLTQIVGRQRELALLHDCLARAEAGRGQVVGIVGEAGVGKSRLLYEFQASLDPSQVTWLAGHCVGYGQGTPYLPILEILRTNFQIEDGDNPLQIQEKLRQGVHRLDPALEEILPSLRELLTVSGEDEALMDCEEARRIGERMGDLFRVYVTKIIQGRVYTLTGEPARGRILLEEGAVLAEQLGTNAWLAWRTSYLAACLLALGELEEIPPLCYEAIRAAEAAGEQYPKTLAQRTLAEALLALDPAHPESAESAMLEAIRLQQGIGAKPELSRSYVSYARMLQARGEGEKARTYLIQAIDMFQQMGMTWDLVRAEQALHSIP